MLGLAHLAMWKAHRALQGGRLEEADRLLDRSNIRRHPASRDLRTRLARGYATRGQSHLAGEDGEAAWADLLQAERLAAALPEAVQLREDLQRRGIQHARVLLEAGEPGPLAEAVALLKERSATGTEVAALEEIGKGWLEARDHAARGEAAAALKIAERIRGLASQPVRSLERFHQGLERLNTQLPGLIRKMNQATAEERWAEVVPLANQVLAMAPEYKLAREARSTAWHELQPSTVNFAAPVAEAPSAAVELKEEKEEHDRFLLWIDGVGGYLVCLGSRVTIGQATDEAHVDIPVLADVSRTHAVLVRDGEGYVLEALRPVRVNSAPTERALLRADDRITLGSSFQLQFRQPVPVSTSARLDLASGHRLPLAVDGVLLMADTLILGPGEQVHVNLPDLKEPIVLFRQKQGLGVRHAGPMTVDGQPKTGRVTLGPTATVVGEQFAFAIEPVGQRTGRLGKVGW